MEQTITGYYYIFKLETIKEMDIYAHSYGAHIANRLVRYSQQLYPF